MKFQIVFQLLAGSTRPRTSPKPLGTPDPLLRAVMTTSSPSMRKVRREPSARVTGRSPFQASSRKEPTWSGSGPETVPDANRSPVRSDAGCGSSQVVSVGKQPGEDSQSCVEVGGSLGRSSVHAIKDKVADGEVVADHQVPRFVRSEPRNTFLLEEERFLRELAPFVELRRRLMRRAHEVIHLTGHGTVTDHGPG